MSQGRPSKRRGTVPPVDTPANPETLNESEDGSSGTGSSGNSRHNSSCAGPAVATRRSESIRLPDTILAIIFELLPAMEMQRELFQTVRQVCTHWRAVCAGLVRVCLLSFEWAGWAATTKLNAEFFARFLKHYRGIEGLSLKGCQDLSDEAMHTVVEGCPSLRSLHVFWYNNVSEAALESVAKGCRDLMELELVVCKGVNMRVLSAFGSHCPNLRVVNLTGSPQVNDAGVTKLAIGCRELRSVVLSSCPVTDDAVTSLATNCVQLTTLSLARCHRVTDAALDALAEGCPHLTTLDLSLSANPNPQGVTDDGVATLATGCPLEVLNLSRNSRVGDVGIRKLAASRQGLRELNVDWCGRITDDAMTALAAHCPQLNRLYICGSEVTDYGLGVIIGGCNLLRFVDITFCENVPASWLPPEARRDTLDLCR